MSTRLGVNSCTWNPTVSPPFVGTVAVVCSQTRDMFAQQLVLLSYKSCVSDYKLSTQDSWKVTRVNSELSTNVNRTDLTANPLWLPPICHFPSAHGQCPRGGRNATRADVSSRGLNGAFVAARWLAVIPSHTTPALAGRRKSWFSPPLLITTSSSVG